jgi:glycosyltransferase involved in cell wall biosynthesis
MTTVNFVVLTKNSESTLPLCLKRISEQKGNFRKRIIVVDHDSIDSTISIAKRFKAKIFNEPTGNMALSRNIGIEKSRGRYLAYIDSDCLIRQDWTSRMLSHLKKKNVAGAGAINYSLEKTWVSAQLDRITDIKKKGKSVEEVPSIWTMNAMYDLKKVGDTRFDHEMKRVGEDMEFNFQLRRKGYRLLYDHKTFVYHQNPTTLRSLFWKWFNYGKGYFKSFKKHPHERNNGTFKLRALYTVFLLPSFLLALMIPQLSFPFYLMVVAPFLGFLYISYLDTAFAIVHWVKHMAVILGALSTFPFPSGTGKHYRGVH